MASNTEQATIHPIFPQEVYQAHEEVLTSLGVGMSAVGKDGCKAYLYVEDGCWDWDDLAAELQEMIVEVGEPYATIQIAYTCSKMRSDEFGGAAWFITPDGVETMSTAMWLVNQTEKLELEMGHELDKDSEVEEEVD